MKLIFVAIMLLVSYLVTLSYEPKEFNLTIGLFRMSVSFRDKEASSTL